jgi:glycosyltransferase involved in cell wall biosynthesis
MPEVVFVMVGNGPEKSRLMVKAASLENVLFFDSASKTDIPSILGRMDALYLGLQRQSLFRFGISPNKLMDYLMAGKPIICAIEAGNDIVSQANCGYSIEPEDPGQIVDAIRKLMKMTIQERNRLGENGKRYVLDNHDYHILAANFIEVMQKAIERK